MKSQSSGQVEALFKDGAISCQINGEEFSYSRYKNLNKEIRSGYLIVLFKGNNYTLYISKVKVFKEGKPAKTSLQSSFPPRFVDDEAYFVAVEKEIPFQIKTSKKEILELASDERRNQFKDFLKDRNVNVKEKNGLIRAIIFLDKL